MVRAFALWLFATTVVSLPEAFELAKRYASVAHADQVAYGGSAFLLAVAALLWLFADLLARVALARPQQVTFESDVPASEWQALAFSAIGLWQSIEALSYLSGRIVRLLMLRMATEGNGAIGLPDDFYGWVAADALRLLLGIGLLFGARGLVGLIRRYRQVGHAPVIASEPGDGGSGPPAST
ncbi:MAG TPA: hypothetical protein VGH80_09490 [Xanthomonadaceae bacterium]